MSEIISEKKFDSERTYLTSDQKRGILDLNMECEYSLSSSMRKMCYAV